MKKEDKIFFQLLSFQLGLVETLEFLILDLDSEEEKIKKTFKEIENFSKKDTFAAIIEIDFHYKPTKKYLDLAKNKNFIEKITNDKCKSKIEILKAYKDSFDSIDATLNYLKKDKNISASLLSLYYTSISFHTLFMSFVILKLMSTFYFENKQNLKTKNKDMKELVKLFFLLKFYETNNKQTDKLYEKTLSLVNIKDFKDIKSAEKKYLDHIEETSKLILEIEKNKNNKLNDINTKLNNS